MACVRTIPGLLLILLLAAVGRADVVVLKNGRTLTGRIVAEGPREVEIDLGDGMFMKVRRASIERIEREETAPAPEAPPPEPEEAKPRPTPEPRKEPSPPGPAPFRAHDGTAPWFERSPRQTWTSLLGRYPELTVAKLTRFRAYRLVERAPLRLGTDDPKIRLLAARYGHGGTIALFKFRFAGTLELRFKDQVKFLGEILNPPGLTPPLVSLEEGPVATAPRLVVFLVKNSKGCERYATTTVFQGRDFRQDSLREATKKRMPIRTFDDTTGLVTTVWMTPKESSFLDNLNSPFGESPRTRIARYRFRIEWYRLPKAKRPPIDPMLLQENAVRPIAAKGRPGASEEVVRKFWGSEDLNRDRLLEETRKIRESLAKLAIRRGHDYRIERDKVGVFGVAGVTLTTERIVLKAPLLEELMIPGE